MFLPLQCNALHHLPGALLSPIGAALRRRKGVSEEKGVSLDTQRCGEPREVYEVYVDRGLKENDAVPGHLRGTRPV
jgi:hypothetical protein